MQHLNTICLCMVYVNVHLHSINKPFGIFNTRNILGKVCTIPIYLLANAVTMSLHVWTWSVSSKSVNQLDGFPMSSKPGRNPFLHNRSNRWSKRSKFKLICPVKLSTLCRNTFNSGQKKINLTGIIGCALPKQKPMCSSLYPIRNALCCWNVHIIWLTSSWCSLKHLCTPGCPFHWTFSPIYGTDFHKDKQQLHVVTE